MGQYFRLINFDKKEYVDSEDIDCGAKLYEWCASSKAGIFPFLLRRSSEGGGGDIVRNYKTAGRWATDRIALVGDYDQTIGWEVTEDFKNISKQVKQDFEHFMKH